MASNIICDHCKVNGSDNSAMYECNIYSFTTTQNNRGEIRFREDPKEKVMQIDLCEKCLFELFGKTIND